jgi:hypothetical protein
MSTKNLARTVIEGGRAPYNQFERRHSSAVERAHAHGLERKLRLTQNYDEALFDPRKRVRRSFSDKLGPARRWLRSQVGRPWNDVRSELFARFDTRTTAGRHIVFDHLLREVRTDDSRHFRYAEFFVSSRGTLRYERKRWPAHWRPRQRLAEAETQVRAWLGARRVIERGERLYWLEPTAYGGFRQRHELTAEEAARFRNLPDWFRREFTGALPVAGITN